MELTEKQTVKELMIKYGFTAPDMTVTEFIEDILPSAQPEPSEITDKQAILHLQSTGWMQNHDREIYESGLREQLADDSGAYDSLIPCEDTISRREAIDAVEHIITSLSICANTDECHGMKRMQRLAVIELANLPSVQPEQLWISCSERLPEDDVEVLITDDSGGVQWLAIGKMLSYEDGSGRFWIYSQNPTAWMPLPESYRAERRTDE